MQQAWISHHRENVASLQGKHYTDLAIRFCSLQLKDVYTENVRRLSLPVQISWER